MNDEVGYDIKTKPEEKEKPKKKSKEEFLREVAEVAVAAGIDAYRKERQKHIQTVRDRRYNNTKLLLRSYRSLREYNEHTIFDIAQLGNEKGNPELLEAIGLTGESRQVESIRERVAFTRVTMENVEIALEVYKRFCNKSPKPEIQRRWRVLEKMYISEECFTPQEVADLENISLSQVYVDINEAAKDMEKRFFGLDLELFD